MAKNLKYYFEKAKKEKFSLGQFNFSDFTQLKAVVAVAERIKAPVILGTSEGESKFFGLEEAVAMRDVFRKKLGTEVFLNLDHGKSLEYVKTAIDAGYDMVHFDGSKLPLEENIKITKQVKSYAKWRGCLVEGEVGRIGTDSSKVYSEKFEIKEEDLTKPEDAKKFMQETGADLLAVSIGNFHGIEISGIDPHLRLELLEKIAKTIPGKLLVLHGGSGTHDEDIQKAISLGVVKININTELRLAFAGNLRRALQDLQEIVPYKFLQEPMAAVESLTENKIRLFTNIK